MDTLIVASIDTETGDATMFSLPRNLQHAPFPEGTALAKTFPWGFPDLLNAVYAFGESRPDLVGFTPYPGAEATKAAAEALLGIRIDYFAMVDLLGFVDVVDTLGGVTVEVGERIPLTNMAMPGQTLPPAVEVGRHHLDGATALAYVRSRINGTDYDRMDRQRCVLVGMANQTSPVELVMRLPELSGAIRSTMTTDIPLDLLPDLVDLLEKVDMGSVKGVAFTPPEFNPANPDFEAMQAAVAAALERPDSSGDAANERSVTAQIDTPENLKASCTTAAAAR